MCMYVCINIDQFNRYKEYNYYEPIYSKGLTFTTYILPNATINTFAHQKGIQIVLLLGLNIMNIC